MERLYDNRLAQYAIGAIGLVSETRLPRAVLGPAIRGFSLLLGVDLDEARVPPGGWSSFGDFFTRRLTPESRPICGDRDALISPCDGLVVDAGVVTGQPSEPRLSIKGTVYGVGELIGDAEAGAAYEGGGYLVVYLHPRDYHGVHAAAEGRLALTRWTPGRRFPVARWAERRIAGVFGRNERLTFEIGLDGGGRLATVMVAAFGVGNLASPFVGRRAGNTRRTDRLDPEPRIARGDELGAFRLGSTVVLVWTAGACVADAGLVGERVRYGRRIGRLPAP
ncbi:MAG TPA: archaetidylserine decarboxylase [Polyangia bacterium]|nr:archaetidylserine decarboxylase [Polyangia bacterium]